MVTDLTWYTSRADMDRTIGLLQSAGVKWIRANMNWSSVEPNAKGSLDAWWLTEIDYAVNKAKAAGIQVLMPIADGVPYWASADPAKYQDASGKHWNRYWKPARFQDYADFARTVVARYQALGVHAYEVWNEPNYSRFWPSGPSAADYTALLRAAYPAIKAADPSAKVVMGGLSTNDYPFLQRMYAAGAKDYFDVAAVHPYTNGADPTSCWYDSGTAYAQGAFCGIEQVRRTMAANGDNRELWLTELGWSTAASASGGVSEAQQATYLTKAMAALDAYPYVTNAFWYALRNNYWQADDQYDVEASYGLLHVDFSPKPAFSAFVAYGTAAAAAAAPSTPPTTTSGAPKRPRVARPGSGYWMLAKSGAVYAFGAAPVCGTADPPAGATAVDVEPLPTGDGYWILDSAHTVTLRSCGPTDGVATGTDLGDRLRAGERPVSLSALPDGSGYWVFTDTGRALPVGAARSFGDMAGVALQSPVLDSVATPTGLGYWMVAADGGIFAFGDARFAGSMGGRALNQPVMSMAPDPDGSGYWLVASDGGVFAFEAPFLGSMGGTTLNRPVTGMVASPTGSGYLMVGEDGGAFTFGDVGFHGSLAASPPPAGITAIAVLP